MKGGIFEWPIINIALVTVLIFIIIIAIVIFFTSVLVGKPVEIRTFTEYRWSNYLPSATLFYLTYNEEDWKILYDIALSPEEGMWTKEQFYAQFSEDYNLDNVKHNIDSLEETLWPVEGRKKHTLFIKDRRGLIISMGLPKEYVDLHGFTTFPEGYPYNCYTKNMPVFSGSKELTNKRIRFVVCCYDIQSCDSYLSGPGRVECEKDPCKISTKGCREIYCGDNCESYEVKECKGRKKQEICVEKESICGNCMVEEGEECDDGRHCSDGTKCTSDKDCAEIGDKKCITRSGDGCSADCKKEPLTMIYSSDYNCPTDYHLCSETEAETYFTDNRYEGDSNQWGWVKRECSSIRLIGDGVVHRCEGVVYSGEWVPKREAKICRRYVKYESGSMSSENYCDSDPGGCEYITGAEGDCKDCLLKWVTSGDCDKLEWLADRGAWCCPDST